MLDVTSYLRPERRAMLEVLRSLSAEQWDLPTECPRWSVKGLALHVLGDDLSLLARQRDASTNGLVLYAEDHAWLMFRELLDGFNEQWVHAAAFLSTALVVELLERSGEWSDEYYRSVDLLAPGEPVGFFGSVRQPSPWWQVVAREYVERWIHHSQVSRALARTPVSDELSAPAIDAVVLGFGARHPELGRFTVGERAWEFHAGVDISLDSRRAEAVLSRALTLEETIDALVGPRSLVAAIAAQTCRADG